MPLAVLQKHPENWFFRVQLLQDSCLFDLINTFVTHPFLIGLTLMQYGLLYKGVEIFYILIFPVIPVVDVWFNLVLYDVHIFADLDVQSTLGYDQVFCVFRRRIYFLSRRARSSISAVYVIFSLCCVKVLLPCSFRQLEGSYSRPSINTSLWFESWFCLWLKLDSVIFIKRVIHFCELWPKEHRSLVFRVLDGHFVKFLMILIKFLLDYPLTLWVCALIILAFGAFNEQTHLFTVSFEHIRWRNWLVNVSCLLHFQVLKYFMAFFVILIMIKGQFTWATHHNLSTCYGSFIQILTTLEKNETASLVHTTINF